MTNSMKVKKLSAKIREILQRQASLRKQWLNLDTKLNALKREREAERHGK